MPSGVEIWNNPKVTSRDKTILHQRGFWNKFTDQLIDLTTILKEAKIDLREKDISACPQGNQNMLLPKLKLDTQVRPPPVTS